MKRDTKSPKCIHNAQILSVILKTMQATKSHCDYDGKVYIKYNIKFTVVVHLFVLLLSLLCVQYMCNAPNFFNSALLCTDIQSATLNMLTPHTCLRPNVKSGCSILNRNFSVFHSISSKYERYTTKLKFKFI